MIILVALGQLSSFRIQAPCGSDPSSGQRLAQPSEHCCYPVVQGSSLPVAVLLVNPRLDSHPGAGDRAASFGVREKQRCAES